MEIQEDKLQQRILRLRKKQITSQTVKHTPQKATSQFHASNQGDADEESSVIFGGAGGAGGANSYPAQTFSSPLKCTRNSVTYLENTTHQHSSNKKKFSQTSAKKGGKESSKQLGDPKSPLLQRRSTKLVNASSPSLPENAQRRASTR